MCVPVVDEPTRNFTAEEPDELLFLGVYWPFPDEPGWPTAPGPNPPPSYCQASTQEAADTCATQPPFPNGSAPQLFFSAAAPCTITCPDGSIVSFTAPEGLFYSPASQLEANQLAATFACTAAQTLCGQSRPTNSEQTCDITCPDDSTASYTVAAGSFMGSTQAEADAAAYAFACSVATLLCDGGPPPELFSSTEQSCTFTCPDGSSITVTLPAGIAVAFSQADADAGAYQTACALAQLYCEEVPELVFNQAQTCSTICNGVTISYTVPAGAFIGPDQLTANILAFAYACTALNQSCVTGEPPPPTLATNTTQICSVSCGDGTFSYTVAAGQYRAENVAAANAIAQSVACNLASNHRTCLGGIETRVCQGGAYSDVISTAGDTPTSWSKSGSLPPGVTFFAGSLMGVATTLGTYNFTVTATTAFGTAVRNYSITVAGISTGSLPDGEVGAAYSTPVLTSGFSSPFFSIVGGSLPSGLVMSSNGAITGTPTSSETANFVVQVEEGGLTCQKSLSITVAASLLAWWTLDAPGSDPATNIDSVSGDLLDTSLLSSSAGVAAVISNGLLITSSGGAIQQVGPNLQYTGDGFSICFWARMTDFYPLVFYRWAQTAPDDALVMFDLQLALGTVTWYLQINSIVVEQLSLGAGFFDNQFHFYCVTYDPTDGKLRGSVDGAALTTGAATNFVSTFTEPTATLQASVNGGASNITYDELGLFPYPLSSAQVAAIWNSGNGQTYPPSPGPP